MNKETKPSQRAAASRAAQPNFSTDWPGEIPITITSTAAAVQPLPCLLEDEKKAAVLKSC